MATDNQFNSRLSQLQDFQNSRDHSNIINTLTAAFDSDANDIIKKWTSNDTLSADEKKYIDSYSIVQLAFVKYCLCNANTTATVQVLIDRIQGRLFQKTQIDTLATAADFIRDSQSAHINDAERDDLILVCIMRMIDARSLAYRLFRDIALPPRKLNDALNECLLHRHAKKYLYDVVRISETEEHMSIDNRHRFFTGCCTFAVARYDENKEILTNNESNNKYICLLAKYVRVMLNERNFGENQSIHYCLRGVLALLTNCIPREYWLSIMNEALANENDEDAQRKNPFNLDLFSSIVNKLLASSTLRKKTEESDLNDETLLVDAVLVFLVKWSDTQTDHDDDEEEERNSNSSSSLDQPNQLLRCFQSHQYFPKTAQRIVPYVEAKYDRVRLMALALSSNIMNYQDFQDLGKQKPHMATNLVKLIFDFIDQAAKQSDYRYKGIPFDTLLLYLHRFLVQDSIKRETLAYLSRVVEYVKQRHLYALKILRRISTSPDLVSDLLKDPHFKRFLDTDADIIHGANEKMSKIIKDIRQNLAPPPPPLPKVTKPSVSNSENHYTAFISYCHDDRVMCKLVQEKLEEAKLFQKIWIDKNNMRDNMIETVTKGINESKVVFVLLSDSYCKSDFCRREWTYAMQKKAKIYVIVVQKDFSRKNYDWAVFQIAHDLYYNIPSDDESQEQKLIKDVSLLLEKKLEQGHKSPSSRPLPAAARPNETTSDGEYLKKASVSTWISSDIQNWCSDNSLEKWRKPLTNFDGRGLLVLRRDLSNDSRLQFIGKESGLDIFDIVRFKSEIDKVLPEKTIIDKLLPEKTIIDKPPMKKNARKRRASNK